MSMAKERKHRLTEDPTERQGQAIKIGIAMNRKCGLYRQNITHRLEAGSLTADGECEVGEHLNKILRHVVTQGWVELDQGC